MLKSDNKNKLFCLTLIRVLYVLCLCCVRISIKSTYLKEFTKIFENSSFHFELLTSCISLLLFLSLFDSLSTVAAVSIREEIIFGLVCWCGSVDVRGEEAIPEEEEGTCLSLVVLLSVLKMKKKKLENQFL